MTPSFLRLAKAGVRAMKRSVSGAAVLATLAVVVVGPLSAEEALPIRNCTWCHGSSAQGYTTAPRIAGQTPRYLEHALMSFKTHARDNPYARQYMWGAVANLDQELAHSFALYFSQLPAEPANDGNGDLASRGRAIYIEGLPDANIVSCIVCHGPEAQGFEAIPRLAGLGYGYLKRRLEQWNEGYHSSAEPMPRIAKTLSASEIEALASYLSFMR
jgi:cytochrome c553